MRYYELTVVDPASGQNIVLAGQGGSASPGASVGNSFLGFALGTGPLATSLYTAATTSNPKFIGQTNPAALNLEIDASIAPLDVPTSQSMSYLRLWGLGIHCISQAWNLNPVNNVFKTFSLKAGMAKGLPLANPAQANLILQGAIYQAFGNWVGTEQTLDLIVTAGPTFYSGVGISFNWQKGESLQSALAQTFKQAFPRYTAVINISANLTAPNPQPAYHNTLEHFAAYLQQYTQWLGRQTYGSSYSGVGIISVGNTLYAFDGQGPTAPKTIALNLWDFVGQPTWIDVNKLTFPCVLRGDIQIGYQVTFPTGVLPPYALTTPQAAKPGAPAAASSTFQGTFKVTEIHHYGNFRQADAASWNTTFVASALLS